MRRLKRTCRDLPLTIIKILLCSRLAILLHVLLQSHYPDTVVEYLMLICYGSTGVQLVSMTDAFYFQLLSYEL